MLLLRTIPRIPPLFSLEGTYGEVLSLTAEYLCTNMFRIGLLSTAVASLQRPGVGHVRYRVLARIFAMRMPFESEIELSYLSALSSDTGNDKRRRRLQFSNFRPHIHSSLFSLSLSLSLWDNECTCCTSLDGRGREARDFFRSPPLPTKD